MNNQSQNRHVPDMDQLSVLAAMILLSFALSRFIELPSTDIRLQLPGVFLAYQVNVRTIIAFLVAGLTASGADWLMRSHPLLAKQPTVEHWLLPALTAWVIGNSLFQLPFGGLWWIVFAIGALLLFSILVAEFIVIDPDDVRNPPAAAFLTAISFVLYLILAISLHSSGARLIFTVPTLGISGWLVSLRTLHLRLHGQWKVLQSGLIALVIIQFSSAFHYWPLSPVSYGLAVLAPAYAMTGLMTNLEERLPLLQSLIEPGIILIILWGLAVWMK